MTLSRKLIILFSLLIFAVFVGTLAITVNNERAYLSEQLGSHAQDAATALSMTLGPAIQNGDRATVMSFVSAMADGGYYQHIRILNQQGQVLTDQHPPLVVKDVPSWFLDLVPLHGPERRALVTSGWRQAGTVLVRSHPGYAYRELWRMFLNMSAWFFFAWIATVLLVTGFVRHVLRPLKDVERQALAIADGQFPPAQRLPNTRELNQVVYVMNKMSERVEKMIVDKTELIKRMEWEQNNDATTGFGTRKYFESQLRHMLEKGDLYAGALFLVRLNNFGGFNDRFGFLEGNARLKTTALMLQSIFGNTKNALLARFGGAELAVFVPQLAETETNPFGEAIGAGFEVMADEEWPEVGHVGIALSSDGDISTVFSKADMALRVAQAKGPNAWHQFAPEALRSQDVHSMNEWRKLLGGADLNKHIALNVQPVVSSHGEVELHHEILARLISSDGSLIPASVFMPMAKRLELAEYVDQVVISKVLSFLERTPKNTVYSVNLSLATICSSWLQEWLLEKLADREELASQLIFELPSPASKVSEVLMAHLVEGLRHTGCSFLLDQCLVGARFPDCLSTIPVAMIKLDGCYTEHMEEPETQRLLEAIKDIAHATDIAVIATHIENRQQQSAAVQLGFDGLQGKLTGLPHALETDVKPIGNNTPETDPI